MQRYHGWLIAFLGIFLILGVVLLVAQKKLIVIMDDSVIRTIKPVSLCEIMTIQPNRGNEVLIRELSGRSNIARIIGFPGEKVTISENKIEINNQVLENNHPIQTERNFPLLKGSVFTLDQDKYFILEDDWKLDHFPDIQYLVSSDDLVGVISGCHRLF